MKSKKNNSVVVMENGVWVGDIYAGWGELLDGNHILITDRQAFLLGLNVGRHIASLLAANDGTT